MIEIIMAGIGLIAVVYVISAFADILMGQPRTSTGEFAPNRTTTIENAIVFGCFIAVGVMLLAVL